jgi:hypothetical protein
MDYVARLDVRSGMLDYAEVVAGRTVEAIDVQAARATTGGRTSDRRHLGHSASIPVGQGRPYRKAQHASRSGASLLLTLSRLRF